MQTEDLAQKIKTGDARLAVIGLGYVGLPVAALFAAAGFEVIGVERLPDRVAGINRGESQIGGDEPGLGSLLEQVVGAGKLRATTKIAEAANCDVVLIAVETPVDEDHQPRYAALRTACVELGAVLRPGSLVIIESTLAPGTLDSVVEPLLREAAGGGDFHLVVCPERVMPGRLLRNLRTMSRVIGGKTIEAAELARALYLHIVEAELDLTDALTAEIVKTAENAYRDVQIAFANEVALLCEALGADVWEVRQLVNKSPGRAMLLPGGGVGGHCIPKDPWLLIANAAAAFQPHLIPAARAVNDAMPAHVARRAAECLASHAQRLAGARIALLGYAYLENSDDTRNSPSAVLADLLRAEGALISIHDPFVPGYQVALQQVIEGADLLILMVGHADYQALDFDAVAGWMRRPILIDARGVVDRRTASASGLELHILGVRGD